MNETTTITIYNGMGEKIQTVTGTVTESWPSGNPDWLVATIRTADGKTLYSQFIKKEAA